jgi:hypothetical protein
MSIKHNATRALAAGLAAARGFDWTSAATH